MACSGQSQDLNAVRLVCAPYKVPLLSEPHATAHLRIPPEFPVTPGRHRTCQGHGPWGLSCFYLIFKRQDFPGGSVVKNPPANAGDTGLMPSLGRSHLLWDNYTCVLQILKPLRPRARAPQQETPPQPEACSLQLECSHHSPQLESSLSSHAATKTQRIQKLINEKERQRALRRHPGRICLWPFILAPPRCQVHARACRGHRPAS